MKNMKVWIQIIFYVKFDNFCHLKNYAIITLYNCDNNVYDRNNKGKVNRFKSKVVYEWIVLLIINLN